MVSQKLNSEKEKKEGKKNGARTARHHQAPPTDIEWMGWMEFYTWNEDA